ncbi:hypothetical protein GCM10028810_09620 [Spirosoma litoris]
MLRHGWVIGLLLIAQLVRAEAPNKESAPKLLGIGDFVFLDYNRNGIQDTGEPGIANVIVRLYQSGIQRGQTTTNSSGQYSFTTGLLPNTAYEVRIAPGDFPSGLKLTSYHQGSNPEVDSDAQLVGGNAVVFLTTNNTNTADNSYDIGFVAGNPDLIVAKTTDVSQTTLGNNATFTIQVTNSGSGAATNVQVRDTLDAGLAYVSSSPAATTTTYGDTRILVWNLGTLTAGATTNLTVTTTTRAEGVLYNTAYVATTDTENSVANNAGRSCVTVPIKLCAGENYVASLPAQYTNVQWFRNGGSTPVATGNSFTIVQSGSYTFTTTANVSCPANGCCPIVVEDGLVPTLAITPTNPAICQGQSTSLTVAGCTGGTLLWSANASSATTASILVSPTATTIYSVTCTPSAYGTCPGVTSTTVTVNPSVTATLSSITICNGTSGTLVAGGGSSYRFFDGTTVTNNTSGTLVVAPTVNGDNPYSVTVTSGFGCSAVATGTVTVNPSVTATLSSITICNGTSGTLVAGGGSSYRFFDGTTVTNNTSGTLVVAPTVNGSNPYSVTVTSGFGCSAVATGTVTVNPSVTATLSSITICNGTSGTLTAEGGTNYRFFDGTTVTNNTSGTLVVAPTVNGDNPYSVTVTSGFGCSAVATGTVTVNPSVTATLSSITICNGTSGTLVAGGGSSYRFFDGTTVTNNTSGTLVVAPTVNGSNPYSVTVTSGFGCSAVATGTVTVNPSVTATIAVTNSTICQGESTTLTAGGGSGYLWSTGATTATISVTASGPYSVTVNSSVGCSAVASTTVTVNPAPQLTINSVTLCAGGTATLTVNGCAGGTLNWATGDNTASLTITPLITTTYSATCTFLTGCTAAIATTVVVNSAPTYSVAPTVVAATCTGAAANNNAHIDFTTLQNAERADISLGTTYAGPAYGAPSNQVVSGGVVSFANLANPASAQSYTIRLYSANGTCFSDVTVVLSPAECECPAPKCVPVVIRKVR